MCSVLVPLFLAMATLLPDRITPVSQSLYEETYGVSARILVRRINPQFYLFHCIGGSLVCCMVMLVLYGLSVLQVYRALSNYFLWGIIQAH